jgi:hypothetical protein
MSAGQELITDEAEIEAAKAGPDVHCAFCGARNPAGTAVCSQCGADLVHGTRREAGRVVGAYQTGPVRQVACPSCGGENPETALECATCGASLKRAPEPKAAAPTVKPKQKSSPLAAIGVFAALGVIALCVIVGVVMLMRPTEAQTGSVARVNWETVVTIEALEPATYENWAADIPAEARLGYCSEKVHHVQDQPAPNANQVCGTPYEVDTGSGFAEVVQDCQYEVLEEWCEYTVMEWRAVDEARLAGTDYSPVFAEPPLLQDQRLGGQGATYTVIIQTSDDTYNYTPKNLEDFRRFQIGSEWILNLNALGGIVSIEPK